MTPSTPTSLRIGFAGTEGADRPHLSVDGMTESGPNLSHWPGNRTPQVYKRDLSTGICLAFAEDDPASRAAFLGDAELVLNDHYDTDGFLSMLAVARPEIALPRQELCLAAAATGDYQAWQTTRGFAVDRIVVNLAAGFSPLAAEFTGLPAAEKALARYRWLIDHAVQVLDRPESLAACWRDEHDAMRAELQEARSGMLQREVLTGIGLSLVTTRRPVARMTLNTLAAAWRVLHVVPSPDGTTYRYHDRTESWFEVVSFTPLPRIDLRPLAARLQELEGTEGDPRHGWHADPPTDPVPELWFGVDEPQAYGQVTRELGASRLPVETVRAVFAEHLLP